jgi:hypothetical protein
MTNGQLHRDADWRVSVISRALGKSGEEAEIDVTSRFDTLALSLLALAEHRCCMNIWEIFILPALARIESRLEGGGGGRSQTAGN